MVRAMILMAALCVTMVVSMWMDGVVRMGVRVLALDNELGR